MELYNINEITEWYVMRSLKRNQQPLYYATYNKEMKIYQHDDAGNILYTEIDGEKIPVELGTRAGYLSLIHI